MLVDARSLDDDHTVTTDVCIIGAGAAGITLAREFAGLPIQVCLLEAGGLKPDRRTQTFANGENVGNPYFPLDETRVCGFGGTTSVWNGACRPLDAIDFEPRAWVPHSGWPFPREHLDPFYAAAQAICQLGPYDYDAPSRADARGTALPLRPDRVQTHLFQISHTRFGQVYRSDVLRARNILTLVYANVLEVHVEDATASTAMASYVRVATLGGTTARVSARLFVLAGGGLENPRLLLNSNSARPAGLGNDHGLVGRFFMEHPTLADGRLLLAPSRRPDMRLYSAHRVQFGEQTAKVEGVLSIAEPVLEQLQLLRCGLLFPTHWRGTPEFRTAGVNSVRQLVRGLRRWQMPYATRRHLRHVAADARAVVLSAMRFALQPLAPRDSLFVRTTCEQAPDPDSRVTLSTQRDELGRRRVKLDWHLSRREIETLRHAHQILAEEVAWAGLGRFESPVLDGDDAWTSSIIGAYHHMGTTRMNRDAHHGVVDEHGRVHSLANVYVAGCSIFPTGGYANPTLTIVALALRLADHLEERLGVSAPRRA